MSHSRSSRPQGKGVGKEKVPPRIMVSSKPVRSVILLEYSLSLSLRKAKALGFSRPRNSFNLPPHWSENIHPLLTTTLAYLDTKMRFYLPPNNSFNSLIDTRSFFLFFFASYNVTSTFLIDRFVTWKPSLLRSSIPSFYFQESSRLPSSRCLQCNFFF